MEVYHNLRTIVRSSIGFLRKFDAKGLAIITDMRIVGVTCLLGAMVCAGNAMAEEAKDGVATVSVDFLEKIGRIRPALHSSGFGPLLCDHLSPKDTTESLLAMNMAYARTHDWAHVNTNERVCDTHFIFPLEHLDPADPKNYYFAATDELLRRTREELGMRIFFRFGTSIEHSGLVHFNTEIPKDFDKTAEIYAGIVRHYNCGWANGYRWGIRYWEVWNEPDGCNNQWTIPGEDDTANAKANRPKRLKLYREFLVKVIRRLKAEFPEIKVGGPAFTAFRYDELREILIDCKTAGVTPDFLSWHYYGNKVDWMGECAAKLRKTCDGLGFPNCELIVNEWHYMVDGGFKALRDPDPQAYARAWESPASLNGIDSTVFTLATLGAFQTSKLDQAYYYGCGIMDRGDSVRWRGIASTRPIMDYVCSDLLSGTIRRYAVRRLTAKTSVHWPFGRKTVLGTGFW